MSDTEIDAAFERLDEAARYLCAAINSKEVPDRATGVAHWVLVVDERIYRNGEYEGAGVFAVSKPEQPSYVSKMLLGEMHDQIFASEVYGCVGVDDDDDD